MKLFSVSLMFCISYVVSQNLPNAPDNIVCFPERDFCSFDGFLAYTGKPLTVEIVRNGDITGSAVATVSGTDVAFEINHPGALCWGDGTSLKVTPDLLKGDEVFVKSGAMIIAKSIIQDGYIIDSNVENGNQLVINGYIGSSTVSMNTEVRIVNPPLKNTLVGSNKIVAVFGPDVASDGYTSSLSVSGTTFKAIFTFSDLNALELVSDGSGQMILMWQYTDAAGNRQGLTISERGEVGGPWSALCPPSAHFANCVPPTGLTIAETFVKWEPVINLPGTPVITGYFVNVMKQNTVPTEVFGYITPSTQTTIDFKLTPLVIGDIVEVRTLQNLRLSEPIRITFGEVIVLPTITITPAVDPMADVATSQVVLSSNTNQMAYTQDGTSVIVNGKLSATAVLYSEPISITKRVSLNAVSYDHNGHFSDVITGTFTPFVQVVEPLPVTTFNVIAENGYLKASWDKPTDDTIMGFVVKIYDQTQVISERPVSDLFLIISNLVPGKLYKFSVISVNVHGNSKESPLTLPIMFPTPVDTITITSATWTNNEFRVRGTGNNPNAIITIHNASPDNMIGSPVYFRGTNVPITGTLTGCVNNVCTFDIRARRNGPSINPNRVFIKSTFGGVFGPFVL
jgi:hypothetical protein